MMKPATLALLTALLLAPLAALAQMQGDSRLQALSTADAGRGWLAVGRLNMGPNAFCTATLIAPDRVLTAAHCLFDRDTGARIDEAALEFLAGWRTGRAEAIRGVRRSAITPGFSMNGADSLARLGRDLAVLELDRPIRHTGMQPFPMAPQAPAAGSAVAVVSYARARAETPSLQDRCTVLDRRREGVLVMSCDIDFGASGAPVFVLDGSVPRIVSVISAMTEGSSGTLALGVQIDGQIGELMAELDEGAGEGARAIARFVRP
ncbi:MAG: trypsin-like peptidase domain-containing protein [Pararhodobacter sp.]|nr:trypsin-like peptidase domain-containing protein [Pararhodobacter sp.]